MEDLMIAYFLRKKENEFAGLAGTEDPEMKAQVEQELQILRARYQEMWEN